MTWHQRLPDSTVFDAVISTVLFERKFGNSAGTAVPGGITFRHLMKSVARRDHRPKGQSRVDSRDPKMGVVVGRNPRAYRLVKRASIVNSAPVSRTGLGLRATC